MSATDLSRLDVAFFNVNGYISVITFVAAVAGLWVLAAGPRAAGSSHRAGR